MKNISILHLSLAFGAALLWLGATVPCALASSQPEKAPKQETAAAEGEKGEKSEKKEKGNEDISGGKSSGDPIYVHIHPVNIPVIDEYGVDQLVTIKIDIQVKDFESADVLQFKMPRVQDAILQALYGGLGNGSLRQGGMINIVKAKRHIARALKRIDGIEAVDDVLIQAVAQRRL